MDKPPDAKIIGISMDASKNITLMVRCPHCGDTHKHRGGNAKGKGMTAVVLQDFGYRHSRCVKPVSSSFLGYNLVLGTMEPEVYDFP